MNQSYSAVATRATAEALELPSLLALCAELAASDLGRERVLGLRPLASKEVLAKRQALAREAGQVLEETTLVSSQEVALHPLLTSLGTGQPAITGTDMVRLASVLETTARASRAVLEAEVEVPHLESLVQGLPDLESLRRRISKCLDKRGRVKDDASPLLSRLRRRVHRVRDGLYKQLQESLAQEADHFASDTVSLKDGRLTLLLHSGAKGKVKGLVHGRSGTGQSFYFEPLTAVDGNNQLQETLEEEDAERQRILVDLIAEAQGELAAIEAHFELLGELDLLQSLHRFADRSGAVFPELAARGGLRLDDARHPLLDPRLASLRESALGSTGHLESVVPLSLELDGRRRILVVTGPNAGGKTVALKTVGLLALAAQSGMPIPVAPGSRIPVFRSVMAMVGDEQDLLTDRSTFSARLLRFKEAWELASPQSLILLDELGSGTDPEEGAALAMALLEKLLDSKSLAVLTTHLTQLAATALEKEGAACAAMEFDPDSGRPTYHLRPGAPGGSQALALAKRLGLPEPWLRRAETLLGPEHRDLRSLLAEVESVRQDLALTQLKREQEAKDLEKIRLRLEDELDAARDERQRLGRVLRDELDDFRQQVRKRLRREVERLQQQRSTEGARTVVKTTVERLFDDAPVLEVEEEVGGPLVAGKSVRHRSLGWTGQLTRIRGDRADVTVVGKRIRCRLDDLVAVEESERDRAARPPRVRLWQSEEVLEDIDLELNLVGERVEPALEKLDHYLDRALLSSRESVRVVHGFGSGRLRKAVREHLEPHPAVASYRPGKSHEGGDGATVVVLNKS